MPSEGQQQGMNFGDVLFSVRRRTRPTRPGLVLATSVGAGKDEATADLQDVLIHQLQGIAQYRTRLAALGQADHDADSFVLFAMFTTLTNVNFNRTRFVAADRRGGPRARPPALGL